VIAVRGCSEAVEGSWGTHPRGRRGREQHVGDQVEAIAGPPKRISAAMTPAIVPLSGTHFMPIPHRAFRAPRFPDR
jgi:hypothetical protein